MFRTMLSLALFVTFTAGYPALVPTADAVDEKRDPGGKTTPGGKLPPRTGVAAQCTNSYCAGVIQELGWKCASVVAVIQGSGYCECQCKDQGGAVTNSKTTSPQHQPAGGGGSVKP